MPSGIQSIVWSYLFGRIYDLQNFDCGKDLAKQGDKDLAKQGDKDLAKQGDHDVTRRRQLSSRLQ